MITVLKLLGGFVGLYLLVLVIMVFAQRSLMYLPSYANPPPDGFGLTSVTVETLTTSDGETLVLWYAPAPEGRPTILFFHGNGGEVADRWTRLSSYQSAGFGAAFLSYRGYGGSSGSPSEDGLIADAEAAYAWLLAQGIAPQDIALVGESLGTGVAVQLAAARPVGAVALGAPYSSLVDVAAGVYPWLPVRLLMRDRFQSVDHIGAVAAPILIQHGTEDRVVPFALGQRLFQAAPAGTEFEQVPGAGHEMLFTEAIWRNEIAFFERVLTDP